MFVLTTRGENGEPVNAVFRADPAVRVMSGLLYVSLVPVPLVYAWARPTPTNATP